MKHNTVTDMFAQSSQEWARMDAIVAGSQSEPDQDQIAIERFEDDGNVNVPRYPASGIWQ